MKLLLLNLYTNGCNRLQKIFHSKTKKTHYFVSLYCFSSSSLSTKSTLRFILWPLSEVLAPRLGTTALTDQGYTTCQPPSVTSSCHPGPSISAFFTQCFQYKEKLWMLDCGLRPRRLRVIYSGGWHALMENVWKQRVQWWTKKYISRCAGMWSLW